MRSITFLLLFFTYLGQAQQSTTPLQFNTQSTVLASPVVDSDVIYIGAEDGVFYALDATSGTLVWKFNTNGNIQAKALVLQDIVFFESANIYYALDKRSGVEKWRYDPKIKPEEFRYQDIVMPYKLDPYDDKRPSAIVYESTIYFGTTNGLLIGLNKETGQIVFSIASDLEAPIRSTPLYFEDMLFFGDWNGVVYCYNLDKKSFKWKKKTYQEKPYPTFGGIASRLVAHNGLLYFGARNPMLNVLDINTGEKKWTFSDAKGGWIIGDPVIVNDTLFMGGSDNFSMYALSAEKGSLLWQQVGQKNIYTEVIVDEERLYYTAGNGYDKDDTGMVYTLNKKSGEVVATSDVPKSVFSAPAFTSDKKIVFGCYDGIVYILQAPD